MKNNLQLIWKHLRQGTLQKMWRQTLWIYQYGRRYWKSMILYTLLGITGSCVSLVSSLISKDLVDIITGHQSLTDYHTGDLVTRWSSDASNISSGILNWIPNLIIYTFRFISALAVVLYYDPTFALFALLGIPFSALMSRPLLRRMRNNN